MNKLKYIFFLSLSFWLLALQSSAQTHKDTLKLMRPVPKVYKFNDNLFWGMTFGFSYSMSEYVRKEPFFKMISPNVDFEFGKHLNRWLAGRVMLGYHSQRSSTDAALIEYFPEAKSYSFSMVSSYVDAMFCLDRLFTPYNPEEHHQFWAFAGLGGLLSFGYSKRVEDWKDYYPIDTKTKMHFAWRAGLEWHYKVSRSTALVMRGLYATTSSSYDGKQLESGNMRHFAEFSVGVNVHLGNRYGQRHFEYCGHNANQYFEVMNSRMSEMHMKYADKEAKAASKVTRTKVKPEQNITESDSILLFPKDYFYLTYAQKMKLKRMSEYLQSHPNERAVIHIYPDAGSTGSMEMEFRVINRGERVRDYLTKDLKLSSTRYRIETHPTERSPYPDQYIFTLGGIIRYESYINQ